MAETDDQVVMAQELSDELVSCGHEISALDILDALAVCRLYLQKDSRSIASVTYLQEIFKPS